MRGRWARLFGAATLAAGVVAAGSAVVMTGAGAAGATGSWSGGGSTYTCTGGVIPPNTYQSIVVTGVCSTPYGNVIVKRNLTVKPGALLDNGTPGDPTTSPTVAAQLYVGGNVKVGKGAVLILGCSPNSSCGGSSTAPPGISSATIRGNVTAYQPLGVVVHSSSIGGNFTVIGGGGGTGVCAPPAPAPWSEDPGLTGIPPYTDTEDVSVGGNYTVVGMQSCWLGTLRDQIRGSATFIGNQFGDPDAMEIGNNLISRNFTCYKNSPAPQFGDGASSDLVAGRAKGQCGFNVVLNNPAAEAIANNGETGVGVLQHFTVSTRHLKTSFGTYTPTAEVASLPSVTTEAGNTLTAELFSFQFAGKGLVGTGTSTGPPAPGQPPGPGASILSTTFPNGSDTFLAYITCDKCSFAGQTGSVSLRAYGKSTKSGFIYGTFLITSNGTVLPSPSSPVPGLATVVGYGSFWGSASTVHLIEHLGFG